VGEFIGDGAEAQEEGLNLLKGEKLLIHEEGQVGEDQDDVHNRNRLGPIFVF
jgi:hypothetical protein